MLSLLLAAARPGQERPTPRDAGDLLGGAVRIRLRREIRSLGGLVWRDAFAVPSLVLTLLLFTGTLDALRDYNGGHSAVQSPPAPVWPMWAPWILVAALSLRGLRRTAAGLACFTALAQPAWLAYQTGGSGLDRPVAFDVVFWCGLAVVAAAALAVSDGLRRALPPRRPAGGGGADRRHHGVPPARAKPEHVLTASPDGPRPFRGADGPRG